MVVDPDPLAPPSELGIPPVSPPPGITLLLELTADVIVPILDDGTPTVFVELAHKFETAVLEPPRVYGPLILTPTAFPTIPLALPLLFSICVRMSLVYLSLLVISELFDSSA